MARSRTLSLDVAVVGASTAGLLAAYYLAQKGYQVGVFERQAVLAPERRTLIITPTLKDVLPIDFRPAVLHQTSVMAVARGKSQAWIALREPDLIVERKALTVLLAQAAQQVGVELILGAELTAMRLEAGTAVLEFRQKSAGPLRVTPRQAVIGADGVHSTVARLSGIPLPPKVSILQAEVELPPHWDPQKVQVWFQREATRFFYWLIPESPDRAVVGLVADLGQNVRRLLEEFLEQQGFRPLAYQGAQVAMHHPRLRPWTQLGSLPVYLVGDAAGQVKVTTVGGTVTGFLGARAAAQAVQEDVPYAHTLRGVKRELDLHWWLRLLLDRLDNRGYDALIRALSPRVREFLASHTRDEMAGVLHAFLLRTPALWQVVPHLAIGILRRHHLLEARKRSGEKQGQGAVRLTR